MIGQSSKHLTFNDFLINLAPVVLIIFVATMLLLFVNYRKQLRVDKEKQQEVMKLDANASIIDRGLLWKSLVILFLTILGFTLHSVIEVDASVIAIGGASLLMLFGVKEHDLEEVFHSVEWTTIFFFAGLFTLVGGLVDTGIISSIAEWMLDLTGGTVDSIPALSMLILWVSGIASATIDNIPFVATMIPLIQDIGHGMGLAQNAPALDVLWWSLALGADLGGNGTLIGASANVIVAGIAMREGYNISYLKFLKVGAPLTLVALTIAAIYIYIRYLLPLLG
jgi:Na+/H+ antiporter NhaD/arsenite permease-like protein